MNKVFKKALLDAIGRVAPDRMPGFYLLDAKSAKVCSGNDKDTIVILARKLDAGVQFVHFLGSAKHDSHLFVEIGRTISGRVSGAGVATMETIKRVNEYGSAPSEVAVRLLFLCGGRGLVEHPWNFFLREKWSREAETFIEFSRRTAFAAFDEKLRVMASGGLSEKYAEDRVAEVLSEIFDCLLSYGIPFLERLSYCSVCAPAPHRD